MSLYPSEALVEGTVHSWFIKEPDPMNSEVAPDIVIVQWDATGLENGGTPPAVEAYYCDDHATTEAESVGAEVAGAATAVACSSGKLPLTHTYVEDTSANTWYRTVIRHCPHDIVSGGGSTLATLLDLGAAFPNGCVETTTNYSVSDVTPTISGVSGTGTVDEGSVYSLTISAETGAADGTSDTITTYDVDWGVGAGFVLNVGPTPTHIYDAQGSYTVTVKVHDEDSEVSDTHAVVAGDVSPIISSIVDTIEFVEGSSGTLTITAASGAGNGTSDAIVSIDVDWDNNGTFELNVGSTPSHTYVNNSSPTNLVTVRVNDEDSFTTETFDLTVDNANVENLDITQNGVSILTGSGNDASVNEGENITLAVSATDPGVNDVLVYGVDWGDGTSTELDTVTSFNHTYLNNGTYTITLVVEDGDGGHSSATATALVSDVSPSIISVVPGAFFEGTPGAFVITANAGDIADPLNATPYAYDCENDGSFSPWQASNSFECTFGDEGAYTVGVQVRDEDNTVSDVGTVTVMNVAPANLDMTLGGASIVSAPGAGIEGTELTLTVSATDAGTSDVLTYTLDWGDGSSETRTGTEFSHTYGDQGTKFVSLQVDDGDGGVTSAQGSIAVGDVSPSIVVNVDGAPWEEGVASTIDVTGTPGALEDSLDPSPYSYRCLSDGSALCGADINGDYLNVPAPGAFIAANTFDCIFADNGTYGIEIWARDEDSYTCASLNPSVANVAPGIPQIVGNAPVAEGADISLTVSATDVAADTMEYTIAWGDGSSDDYQASQSFTHAYSEDGDFTITVTAKDKDDGITSVDDTITVTDIHPTISAAATATLDEGQTTGNGIPLSGAAAGSADALHASPYAYVCKAAGTLLGDVCADSDGDATNGSFDNVPAGAAFSASNEALCTFDEDGTYFVEIWARDEDSYDCGSVIVTVNDVDPVLFGGASHLAVSGYTEGAPAHITIDAASGAEDGTSDNLHANAYAYDCEGGVNWSAFQASNEFTCTYVDNGTYTVAVKAQDEDSSTSGTIDVVVDNVAPVIEAVPGGFTCGGAVGGVACDPADLGSCGGNVALCAASPLLVEGTDTFDFAGASFSDPGDDSYTAVWTLTDPIDGVLDFPISSIIVDGDATGAALDHLLGATDVSYAPKDDQSGANATTVVQACLTVSDDDGDSDTECFTITLQNAAPVITAFAADSTTLGESDAIIFTTTVTDAGNGGDETLTYTWNWGDGTTSNTNEYNLPLGTHQTSHIFKEAGDYTVSLTVTDDDGGSCVSGEDCSGTTVSTVGVTVINVSPKIIDVLAAGNKVEGEPIEALVKLERNDVGVLSYKFDWGDGTIDDGAGNAVPHDANDVFAGNAWTCNGGTNDGESCDHSVSTSCGAGGTCDSTWGSRSVGTHTYAEDGAYDVRVYVQDQRGGKHTNDVSLEQSNNGEYFVNLPVSITVGNAAPTGASISFASHGSEGGLIEATVAEALDAGSDDSILTYTVDWGDGSTPDTQTTHTGFTHIYSDNGNYVATLVVTDSDGATAQASASVVIANEAPVSLIHNAAGVEGVAIHVDVSLAVDAGNDAHVYTVDWGDGESSVQYTHLGFSHIYDDNGSYTATLTVTDEDGGVVNAVSTITVENVAPVGVGISIPATSDEGVSVAAIVASALDVHADPLTYTIDWGDGSSDARGTHAGFAHTYGDNGVYTVALTVDDGDGGVVGYTTSITVANVAPAGVSIANATGTEGVAVTAIVTAASDVPADTLTYTIDWGGPGIQNPNDPYTFIYADNGAYTVTLVVRDEDGGQAQDSALMTIGNSAPGGVFIALDAQANEGALVAATLGVATDIGGDDLTYTVNWGDGASDTKVNDHTGFTHTYLDNGDYTATLRVTDSGNASVEAAASITVVNVAPAGGGIASASGDEGMAIALTVAAATDVDADSLTYTVDWGDGHKDTRATNAGFIHTYADNGVYTATLTVRDEDGGSAVETASLSVANVVPTGVTMVLPATSNEGAAIALTLGAASDVPADPLTYTVNWGDGQSDTGDSNFGFGHTYGDNGDYTVTLTVDDGDNGSVVKTGTIAVGNLAPVGVAIESGVGEEGSLITAIVGRASDVAGDSLTYAVNWGDGTPVTTQSTHTGFTHTYVNNGNYTATLTVTDKDNGSAVASATMAIGNEAPAGVSIALLGQAEEGALVTATVGDASDVGDDDLVYLVDWGDGSETSRLNSNQGFTHTYLDNGDYTVTLTVTDSGNASAAATTSIRVVNLVPAGVSLEASAGNEGEALVATVGAATDVAADPLTYTMSWGDGQLDSSSTNNAFAHTYADNGVYEAVLTVKDDDGGSVSATATMTIGNVVPTGVSLAVPASGNEGAKVVATVGAATDVAADPLTYTVTWGDGKSDTNNTHSGFVHTYADNGSYTVTLTVNDGDTGSVSDTGVISVLNVAPVGVTLEPGVGTEGSVVTAIVGAARDVAADSLSYTLDWGDGSAVETKGTHSGFTHVYADDGSYAATITVTDKDGGEVSASASMMISNVLPVVSVVTPTPIDEATSVFVEVTALDAGDDALGFLVDWDGDGSFDSVTPSHTAGDVYTLGSPEYGDNGLYIVPIRVMDGDVFTALDVAVVVNNLDPTFSSPAVATEGSEGTEAVQVRVSATDVSADSGSLEYRVDWGDGEVTASSSNVLSHVYGDDGAYTASVSVEDKDGGSVQEQVAISVSNVAPVIELVAVASPVLLDSSTSVAITAKDPGSDELIYFWDFDYDPAEPNPTWEHTSTSNIAFYTYETSGSHLVRVKVWDGAEEVYGEKTVVVLNQGSLLAVEADNDAPAEGSAVTLTLTPYGNAGDVFTVQVDWEDDGDFEADEILENVAANESGVGTVEIAHVYADNQVANVRVKAFNTHKDNDLSMASLEVDVRNEAPTVTSGAPDADASEGALYEHVFTATDPAGENDPLVYTLVSGPSGMKLDSVTGALAWTPDYTHVRESASQLYSLTVEVSDDDGGTTRVEWTVAVARLDTDSDGLSDAWEAHYFGDTVAVDGAGDADSDGDGLGDSAEFGYGTDPLVSNAPGKPVPLHPGNIYVEALTQSLVVENAVDPDNDALTYTFELYDNAALSGAAVFRVGDVPEGEGTTSVVIEEGVLSDYQRYWWVAYGNDGLVDGAHSDTVWFEVSTANRVPAAPVALMPVADEVVTTLQPYFEAQRVVDPDGDTVTYEFAVYSEPTATAQVSTVAGRVAPTWNYPAELTNRTTYWWRVRAHDGASAGAWSREQAFRVLLPVVNTPPTAPAIESPVVGGVLTAYAPTLMVGASTDAEGDRLSYSFEVATNASFEGPSVDSATLLRGTGWTPRQLHENTLYYWRARAFDGALHSAWTVGYFTMNSENDAPGVPVVLSPANGVVVPEQPGGLTVINAEDLDGDVLTYNFQLAADPEGLNILAGKANVASGENTTTWDLSSEGLEMEDFTTYYWRAQAFDGVESGEFTEWQAFSLFLPKDYREVAIEEIVAHGCSSIPPGIWLLLPLLGFFGRRRRR